MTALRFDAHGSFSLAVENNIIKLHVYGPGNLELIKEYFKQTKPMFDSLRHDNWGTLLVLDGMSLYSPAARDYLIQGNLYAKERGAVATAAIIKNAEYKNVTLEFWEGVFIQSKTEYAFFDSVAMAEKWLVNITSKLGNKQS